MARAERSVVIVLLAICALALVGRTVEARRAANVPAIAFAGVDKGRRILTTEDDFVRRLSPFDRAARMKTDRTVSQAEFLRFIASNVTEWTSADKARVQNAWNDIAPGLGRWSLPLPDPVLFVETTGNEEGEAAYTRANAIVLPKTFLAGNQGPPIDYLIAHELFHVLSRHAPALHERLYDAIGFMRCGEQPYPRDLADRSISNPDAPHSDHCIQLHAGDEAIWAVPILFSSVSMYDMSKGGQFFDYLQFKLLVVQRAADGHAHYDASKPRLVDVDDVTGFFEQVGKNTKYILDPEEILADNFAFLVLGKTDVPSPDVQRRIDAVLSGRGPSPRRPLAVIQRASPR